MKTKTNKWIQGIVSSLVIVIAVGCQSTQEVNENHQVEGAPTQQEEKEEATIKETDYHVEEVEITMMTMYGGMDTNRKIIEDIIKDYEVEKEGISIHHSANIPTEIWQASTAIQFEVDQEPDILHFYTHQAAYPMLENDQFVSVQEIREEYPNYAHQIDSWAIDNVKYSDGKSYAIPIQGDYLVLYCNTDLFEQYEIKEPSTWEDFLKAIVAFKEKGITPIATSFKEDPSYWIEYTMILADRSSPLHNMSIINNEERWYQAFGYLQTFIGMEAFSTEAISISQQEAIDQFVEKEAAMMIIDHASIEGYIEHHLEIEPFLLPTNQRSSKDQGDLVLGFSEGFYITRKAWEDLDKRETIVELMNTILSNESYQTSDYEGLKTINLHEEKEENELLKEAAEIHTKLGYHIEKEIWEYLVENLVAFVSGEVIAEEIINKMMILEQ